MKVSEFMTKNVVSLTLDNKVEDAAKLMLEKNISAIPIVDQGNLVGIITESDFIGKDAHVPHALASIKSVLGQIFYDSDVEDIFKKVKHLPIEKVMTGNLYTVSPEHSLNDVVALMNSKNLKRILVVENNNLVGIVTRRDVVRAFTLISPSQDNMSSTI